MQCNLNDCAQTCTDLNNRSASNLCYWLHATGGAGDPTLAMWSKREEPVLPMPPPDMPLVGWRDPFIFEIKGKQGNGQEWGMLMGSGLKGQGGAIMIYRSESLYGGTLALCLNLLQSTCILQLNVSFSVPSCFARCAHEYALSTTTKLMSKANTSTLESRQLSKRKTSNDRSNFYLTNVPHTLLSQTSDPDSTRSMSA